MLTSSQYRNRECSSSDAMYLDEMSGWASVAEALLTDCARVTLLSVAEPTARQDIVADYTESLARLVQHHLSVIATAHQRDAAQEEQRRNDLVCQLHTAVQECDSMSEQLVAERTSRVALEEELEHAAAELRAVQTEREALQAERAAVWNLVRGAIVSSTRQRNIVSPANATLEDHVRYLCDWVKDAEEELASATASAAALGAPAPQQDEAPTSIFRAPRATYRRVLPSAPLNPVTASLLRVKEQVQQLREPSVTQLQQAVGAYRPLREESLIATPPAGTRTAATTAAAIAAAAATTGVVTPLSVDRSLGLSRSYTPHRNTVSVVRNGTADDVGASSPPWRTHIAKLQEELKGLRRDMNAATPRH